MKKFICSLFFVAAITLCSQVAQSEGMEAAKPPTPMAVKPAVATEKPSETATAVPAMAESKAATKLAEPKPEAPVDIKAPATAAPTVVLKPWQGSKDRQASFWLTLITPILLLLIGILGTLGFMKWTKDGKATMVTGMIQKGVAAFLKYAEGTKAEWDDAVAKLLHDVNEALVVAGKKPLTPEEEASYKKLAEKEKDIQGPDKKAEEKKPEK